MNSTWQPSSERVLFVLSILGLIWYFALWAIGLLGCLTARRRYRLRPRSPLASAPPTSVPGVSILRPLKGLDHNLYENLESTFTQEYSNYEIILSVADEDDQALSVVRDLVLKYPGVNSKVIIGEEIVGINPKVNNLIRSYREAANDIIWVVDSNVTAAPGTLARSVDVLVGPGSSSTAKRIGLVHHVPFAFASESEPGSKIEEVFINTNHAKMYLAINFVAIESCVVGKSNLYRRSDIERVNGSLKPVGNAGEGANRPGECGLPAFGRFLAEDNMIASALWHELGLRHDLSCDVVRNIVGKMSFSDYIWRRVRWIRVRKHMVLAATVLEPFTECVILSIMGSASLQYIFGLPLWIFLISHFPLWLMVDLDVYTSLAGHPVPSLQRWRFIGAWAAREILALPIWILAMCGDEVSWRGKSYQVLRDGEVKKTSSAGGFVAWLRSGWKYRPKDNYEQLDTDTN